MGNIYTSSSQPRAVTRQSLRSFFLLLSTLKFLLQSLRKREERDSSHSLSCLQWMGTGPSWKGGRRERAKVSPWSKCLLNNCFVSQGGAVYSSTLCRSTEILTSESNACVGFFFFSGVFRVHPPPSLPLLRVPFFFFFLLNIVIIMETPFFPDERRFCSWQRTRTAGTTTITQHLESHTHTHIHEGHPPPSWIEISISKKKTKHTKCLTKHTFLRQGCERYRAVPCRSERERKFRGGGGRRRKNREKHTRWSRKWPGKK